MKIVIFVHNDSTGSDCHGRDQAVNQGSHGFAASSGCPIQLSGDSKIHMWINAKLYEPFHRPGYPSML